MRGSVELNLTVDDLIKVDEEWNSPENCPEHVVRFLGVEVGRYKTDETDETGGWPPEGFSPSELEERAENMVRALWALGEKKGS